MNETPAVPRRARLASRLLVIGMVGIFLFGIFGFALAVIDARGRTAEEVAPPSLPALSQTLTEPSEQAARGRRIRVAVADTEPDPSPSPLPQPSPSSAASSEDVLAATSSEAPPLTLVDVRTPVVAVVSFWDSREGIRRMELKEALENGRLKGYKRVVVHEDIAELVAEELAIELHPDVRRLDTDRLDKAVSRGGIGVIAASDMAPSTRSLQLNGVALVGVDRTNDIADWPLTVPQTVVEEAAWDQARTWAMVAGGDSFTDRGVYDAVVRKGKGVDYPFAGGTAKVTGFRCCDPVFNDNIVPTYVLTGNKGIVRRLFRGADLAIANHEQPVTEQAAFHSSGTRFSGKPALTRIFTRAGIDYLSLANNHIGDYGSTGIKDTRRILRQNDIVFGGAGKDLEQARRVDYLDAGGTKVAIIPCLDIVKIYWAEAGRAGATPCLDRYLVPDIKKAKRDGAVVVVFPHWGVEYTRQPLGSMRKHAARWTKAGADLVLGAHSHVAGAIEEINDAAVLYSLGNLIFDQRWSTNTMESALLEATFQGDALVELRLRPYIVHDSSQPNFLDPSKGEGRRLLRSIKKASSDWLAW